MMLRKQLLLIFLPLFVVVIAVVMAIHFYAVEKLLKTSIENNILTLAEDKSRLINYHIQNMINSSQSIAAQKQVVDAVKKANQNYAGISEEQIKRKIEKENIEWLEKKNNYVLAKQILSNTLSRHLIEKVNFDDGIEGIFVTDRQGAMIGMSSHTSDYNQHDEQWWSDTYQTGQAFLDDRSLADNVKANTMTVVVPVLGGTEIIGIVKISFNVSHIVDVVNDVGSKGKDNVYISLASSRGEILLASSRQHEDHLSEVEQRILKEGGYGVTEDFHIGKRTIMAYYPVAAKINYQTLPPGAEEGVSGEKWIPGQWILFADIEHEYAYTVLTAVANHFKVMGIIVLLLILFIVIGFGRKILLPITTLAHAVEKMGEGVFLQKISINGKNEFSQLSSAFNMMSSHIVAREHELRKLSGAVEQSHASIVITDLMGNIEYVNKACCRNTGYTEEELLGQNPRIFKSGQTSEEIYRDLWATITSGQYWQGELQNRKKNGELFWESIIISPIRNGEGDITHFVEVKEDVTARTQATEVVLKRTGELENANESLEKSRRAALSIMQDADSQRHRAEEALAELALSQEDLEQARMIADAANVAKSSFLATMSHEIRTPMNAITGMTHLALQTELTVRQRNYLNKIEGASQSLLSIINDILDFSKVEAGELKLESINFCLDDVLHHTANLTGYKINEKGLEFLFDINPDVPTMLVGDPLRLGQVIVNLLSNAAKFTEKGEIVLTVENLTKDSVQGQVMLQFSVQDTGIGMTAEQQGRLFKAFAQADSTTTRKYGGTGLGLVICKRLSRLMHGDINVNSVHGVGSTFTFTAQFGMQPNAEIKHNFDDVQEIKGVRVLVVDDNASTRNVFHKMLKNFDCEVVEAASGEEGSQKFKTAIENNEPYQLVLMDWNMPGMSGLESIQLIRAHEYQTKTPCIIMVSSYAKNDVLSDSADLTIDHFLYKPVSLSSLLDALMQTLLHKTAGNIHNLLDTENEREAVAKLGGVRVLLVEDNEFNQEVAMELLSNAGMIVQVAINGQEALDILNNEAFDIVLMDVQMPVMDGYTATRAIREQQRFRTLPVIAITADAMTDDQQKCLDAGMNDFISKPINVSEMFITIADWVTRDDEDRID